MAKRILAARAFSGIALALLAGIATAAEFEFPERFDGGVAKRLRISGTIVAGDHQKYLALVRQHPTDVLVASNLVELDSPGGDVKEAMALAAALKELYPRTHVARTCASSCVLLWLAGSSRNVEGRARIGIHRPSFLPGYFKGLSVKEAERQYNAMAEDYRRFILGQGLPQSLYERLMATSSTEVYWLTSRDIDLIGMRPPYYDEKLKASCGKYLNNVLRNGTDADRFKACDLLLARKEKVAAIEAILGAQRTPAWDSFRDNYLRDIRLD